MRRVAVLASVVLLAGCGVLDDEGPAVQGKPDPAVYGPSSAVPGQEPAAQAPPERTPSPEVASALASGGIAVVDATGAVLVKPSVLETSSDGRVEDVRWSGWDADGAAGTGEFVVLTCQPTCASGGTDRVPARITLSGVKTCSGRRYFSAGEVLIDPRATPSGAQPATYLRAPC